MKRKRVERMMRMIDDRCRRQVGVSGAGYVCCAVGVIRQGRREKKGQPRDKRQVGRRRGVSGLE
jgi:hypothetical protein